MRSIVMLSILVVLLLVLTSCGVEFGANYKNLQEQDPTNLRKVYDNGTVVNVKNNSDKPGGLYDELNDNLCDLSPHCCGDFSDEEIGYYDLQQRAIVEHNKKLCNQLPDEPLVIDCPDKEPYAYYNKTDCLAHFN